MYIRDTLQVLLLLALLKIRWMYFHIHPSYVKFYTDELRTEAYFQNIKTGTLHSQVMIEFHKDSIFYREKK